MTQRAATRNIPEAPLTLEEELRHNARNQQLKSNLGDELPGQRGSSRGGAARSTPITMPTAGHGAAGDPGGHGPKSEAGVGECALCKQPLIATVSSPERFASVGEARSEMN
jgi:hypothetical protein